MYPHGSHFTPPPFFKKKLKIYPLFSKNFFVKKHPKNTPFLGGKNGVIFNFSIFSEIFEFLKIAYLRLDFTEFFLGKNPQNFLQMEGTLPPLLFFEKKLKIYPLFSKNFFGKKYPKNTSFLGEKTGCFLMTQIFLKFLNFLKVNTQFSIFWNFSPRKFPKFPPQIEGPLFPPITGLIFLEFLLSKYK